MNELLFSGLAIFILAFSGCVQNSTPGDIIGDVLPNGGTTSGMLILGAACEQDADCVYAINAYPTQKCISANCPPPEDAQPETGDPAYEWKQTYLDECVNSAQLNGKNVQGEDLLIDSRAASCACQTIDAQGTSLDGQKICRKQVVQEETPIENTGI